MSFPAALLRAILSAAYWFAVLVVLYASVAGDPAEPREGAVATYAAPLLVVVAGVLLHAVLARWWARR